MPRLTLENVLILGRAARRHLTGREQSPASIEEYERVRDRLRASANTNRSVVLYRFGPRPEPFPSPYFRLDAVGISDYVRTPRLGEVKELVTIEQSLLENLQKSPGCDLILVFHPRSVMADDEEAAAIDADFRACAAKIQPIKKRR
jgi:hypothetical protein